MGCCGTKKESLQESLAIAAASNSNDVDELQQSDDVNKLQSASLSSATPPGT